MGIHMPAKRVRQAPTVVRSASFAPQTESPDADLLAYYLGLPPSKRNDLFVDTATAADRIGVSQRTIQAWIDVGLIRAVPIGKKFHVALASLLDYVRARALRQST